MPFKNKSSVVLRGNSIGKDKIKTQNRSDHFKMSYNVDIDKQDIDIH